MIFKQVLVDQILAGRKRQTRRPVNFDNPRSHYWHERCRYRPGSKLTVQANYNGPAPARGVVIELRRERWCDITEADARAEGFVAVAALSDDLSDLSARGQFLHYVGKLYPDLDQAAACWVITFALDTDGAQEFPAALPPITDQQSVSTREEGTNE